MKTTLVTKKFESKYDKQILKARDTYFLAGHNFGPRKKLFKNFRAEKHKDTERMVFGMALTFDKIGYLPDLKYNTPTLQVFRLPPGILEIPKMNLFYQHLHQ